MIYHQSCRICTRILTIEEMTKHLVDYKGLCNRCREDKIHADSFIQHMQEVQTKEE